MLKRAFFTLLSLLLPAALAETSVPCKNLFPSGDFYNNAAGSTYIPLDNWIYPALDRLYSLGQVDTAYLGMRPWTRLSVIHMLETGSTKMDSVPEDGDACRIYHSLQQELEPDVRRLAEPTKPSAELESAYTRFDGISGIPLRDSFHLGQSIVNDYGRPYAEGFNSIQGFSTRMGFRRFAFYFRGEYQHAAATTGYSSALAELLSENDGISFSSNPKQDTIPEGPIASINQAHVVNASVSYLLLNHEISFGKNDHWLGPARGGSFAWSNNAANIYAFQIDRVEPLRIPFVSRYTGPFRYQFFVGSLQGHTDPNAPWAHAEKFSFKPTVNLELGFERTVIWGGKNHAPITVGSFLRSFFSLQAGSAAEKVSRNDPGARFSTFDFSYRLPYLRDWLTLYTDSLVHDDVSPISAPRRAGYRPGLYLSHFPRWHALDFRVEAANTDPPTHRSNGGLFLYWEQIQKQGYTNKGIIFGDWIGRESKGGQAWLTYHLSPKEQVQLSYRNAKAAKDFIPGGTTQNSLQGSIRKRVTRQVEVQGLIEVEEWKAPIYLPQKQNDIHGSLQVTWYP